MKTGLRIGTRGSPLALWQANTVRAALLAAHGHLDAEEVALEIIKTSGDKVLDMPLLELGGKGLFTKELEDGLLEGRLDIAVHSTKDMPTANPPGLELACFLVREDPRDAFLSPKAGGIDALEQGSVVGTASLRRQAQILARRPDLKVITFRGNVETRMRKLSDGQADATMLAFAGLKRLGYADKATAVLATDEMLPAPAQGAVCIQCRSDDGAVKQLLAPLNDAATATAVTAERAFLAALEGSCRTPIAALAVLEHPVLRLRGKLLSPDGRHCFEITREGLPADAADIGREAGLTLRGEAGETFFQEILGAV